MRDGSSPNILELGAELSQADGAYAAIKEDILTCVIPPKSRLTEAELAKRYDLGRAAIRTALVRLSHESLVDALPRYGYVVAGYDELGARDLFQIQLMLEPAAGRLAAGRVDAGLLRELDAACEAASVVRSVEDAVKFLRANTNFHVAVAQASGNALLARFVRTLYERLERLLYASGRIEPIVRELAHTHAELVDHLMCSDGDAAEKTVRKQISRSHAIMIKHLSPAQ